MIHSTGHKMTGYHTIASNVHWPSWKILKPNFIPKPEPKPNPNPNPTPNPNPNPDPDPVLTCGLDEVCGRGALTGGGRSEG